MSFAQVTTEASPTKLDRLTGSLDRLDKALDINVPGNEWHWANTVENSFAQVESALREHRALARSPNGILSGVDETRPSMARQADTLRNDFDHLVAQILVLRKEVRRAAEAFRPPSDLGGKAAGGEIPDFGAIRQQAKTLLAALQQDMGTELCLIMDSVNTDIGGGD
jgi:hypothetical protein